MQVSHPFHPTRYADASIRNASYSRVDSVHPSAAGPRRSDEPVATGDGRAHNTPQHSRLYQQTPYSANAPPSSARQAQNGGGPSYTLAGARCPYHGPILALQPPRKLEQCQCMPERYLSGEPGQRYTLSQHGPDCGLTQSKGCICASLISESDALRLGRYAAKLAKHAAGGSR